MISISVPSKIHIRYGMEANQIHTTIQSTEQLHQFLGINQAVVHSLENDVFKRQTALLAEIILAENLHYLGNGESLSPPASVPCAGKGTENAD